MAGDGVAEGRLDVSVVIPVHDEEDSVPRLHLGIEEVMGKTGRTFEVVFVDDASRDGTWGRLQELQPRSGGLVLARLRRNFGQTPALAAGFDLARGQTVVTLDGDLQNDPADIPTLLERIDGGCDLVCGWRKNRKDKLLSRKIPSRCANWLIRRVTGVPVHDYGCGLKAYKKSLLERMRLYSDLHRFLPFWAQQTGVRIDEVVVTHHPRRFGHTKYGIGRTFRVLADLLALKMIVHYRRRIFLWFALLCAVMLGCGLVALGLALVGGGSRTVLFGSGLILASFSLEIFLVGFLSELSLEDEDRNLERTLQVEVTRSVPA